MKHFKVDRRQSDRASNACNKWVARCFNCPGRVRRAHGREQICENERIRKKKGVRIQTGRTEHVIAVSLDSLQSSSILYYMNSLNNIKLCILPRQCMNAFRMTLTINSEYFLKYTKMLIFIMETQFVLLFRCISGLNWLSFSFTSFSLLYVFWFDPRLLFIHLAKSSVVKTE